MFRNNTFTKIKGIIPTKICDNSYDIYVDGMGYCSGTSLIYVKSKSDSKYPKPEDSFIDFKNENYEIDCNNRDNKLTCKRNKF